MLPDFSRLSVLEIVTLPPLDMVRKKLLFFFLFMQRDTLALSCRCLHYAKLCMSDAVSALSLYPKYVIYSSTATFNLHALGF